MPYRIIVTLKGGKVTVPFPTFRETAFLSEYLSFLEVGLSPDRETAVNSLARAPFNDKEVVCASLFLFIK